MPGQGVNAGRHPMTLCGAELYPLGNRDAGWECIRPGRCTGGTHRDLDGTEWPVGQLTPLFVD